MPTATTTKPTLERRDDQACVFMPITVPMKEWGRANALVPELFAWIGSRGIAPTGPLFYRYLVIGDAGTSGDAPFRLEIGIPIEQDVTGDDRVSTDTIPAGTYATVTHRGHPDQLQASCAALESWAEKEGILFATENEDGDEVWLGRYEFYLTNPEAEPDLNKWETRVAYLVKNPEFVDSPDLKLSRPAQRALATAGITTLAELARWREKDVLALHGMGKASMPPLRSALAGKGLSFAGDQEQS